MQSARSQADALLPQGSPRAISAAGRGGPLRGLGASGLARGPVRRGPRVCAGFPAEPQSGGRASGPQPPEALHVGWKASVPGTSVPGQRGSSPTRCPPLTPRGRCSSGAAPRAGVCLPGPAARLFCVWPPVSVTVPIATACEFLAGGPEEGRKPLEMAPVAALFRRGSISRKEPFPSDAPGILVGPSGLRGSGAGGLSSPLFPPGSGCRAGKARGAWESRLGQGAVLEEEDSLWG